MPALPNELPAVAMPAAEAAAPEEAADAAVALADAAEPAVDDPPATRPAADPPVLERMNRLRKSIGLRRNAGCTSSTTWYWLSWVKMVEISRWP